MTQQKQQAPMSQRLKAVWTVVSVLGGMAASVLLAAFVRRGDRS